MTKYGKFMYNLCYKGALFLNKNPILYYLLAYTWGFIMTFIGLIITLVLLICGKKPIKYEKIYYFKVFKRWGGFEMGQMFVRDTTSSDNINKHEYGHTFQNAILGPFFIFLVAIPSAIRYWYREYLFKHDLKKYCELPTYDAIWFEGNATDIGKMIVKEE